MSSFWGFGADYDEYDFEDMREDDLEDRDELLEAVGRSGIGAIADDDDELELVHGGDDDDDDEGDYRDDSGDDPDGPSQWVRRGLGGDDADPNDEWSMLDDPDEWAREGLGDAGDYVDDEEHSMRADLLEAQEEVADGELDAQDETEHDRQGHDEDTDGPLLGGLF